MRTARFELVARACTGESLAAELTVSFENANDIVSVLSPQRMRVLELAKEGPKRVASPASGLNRDLRALSRDVDLLERLGLLRSRYETDPGHLMTHFWRIIR